MLNFAIPLELIAQDGVSEGANAGKGVRGDGVFGRKSTGGVSTRTLVGEYPEVEFREEAGEVVEGFLSLGEGLHPEV